MGIVIHLATAAVVVTIAWGHTHAFGKLGDAVEVMPTDQEDELAFVSVLQCAMRASSQKSTYFGTRHFLEGMRCYLSTPQASAESLQRTDDLNSSVWALLDGQTQVSGAVVPSVSQVETTPASLVETTSASQEGATSSGVSCTACNPSDPTTWGIIPGQVGCSTYNMCTVSGLVSQSCGVSLVLSSLNICDFSFIVNEPCLC
ncbi:uncharacterized protein LOC135219301 [Macrobrachium nipponense]|uniref:uncharacterized protein LOC135219301 n=1 Tax=Macrobrachium nipponense TaxID=159736 RepID=UPI0030C8560B